MLRFKVGDVVIANDHCNAPSNVGAIGTITDVLKTTYRVKLTHHSKSYMIGRQMIFVEYKLDYYVTSNRSALYLLPKR
jgi:hypothetical protein